MLYPPHLRRTLATALLVGSVIFVVNHLDQVITGRATTAVWVETAVSFLVPFCTSNIGLLVARRRQPARRVHSRRVAPTWERVQEWPRCIFYPPHLFRTLVTALVIGTVLFAINQLGLVIIGHASTGLWIKVGLTYLVPFSVANSGVLVGCSRRPAARN